MYDTDDDLVEFLLIPGVGRARARALRAAGFRTLEDLAAAEPREIAGVHGIGISMASDIRDFARSMGSGAGDEAETANELLICPMCGSMVSAGAGSCPNCGIAFSDDVEDIDKETPRPPSGDADGHWYKDEGGLFLCPECGSMVAEGADSCPNCGVLFEGEEEPGPEDAPEGVAKGEDGYWYRDEARLYMCPNCGSFIPADADGCPHCGIVFEVDEEELPPRAGPSTCPMCGVPLEPGAAECANCGFSLKGDRNADGFWYGEQRGLYMCPECGSFVPGDATRCPQCGAEFGETEEESTSQSRERVCPMCGVSVPDGGTECSNCGFVFGKEGEEDGYWYKERGGLFICPECGAFVSETAETCPNCGVSFGAVSEGEGKPGPAPAGQAAVRAEKETPTSEGAESAELESELESLIVGEGKLPPSPEEAAGRIYLCPICGTLISPGHTRCPSCGTVLDDIEEMELGPVSVDEMPESADLEEISREIEEEIGSIEAGAAGPESVSGGVSRDFLKRWKKLTSDDREKSITRDLERELAGARDELGDLVLEPAAAGEAEEGEGHNYWRARSDALASQGDTDRAISILEEAAGRDPDNETEYKRRILELLGVGAPRPGGAEAGEVEEEIGDLAVREAVEAAEAKQRLGEIEAQLSIDPENGALWQEKGEILERLGEHRKAIEAFDRSIDISYSALSREAGRGLRSPQISIGLTNGQGRINGTVNGLMKRRGTVNGFTNGRGRINGLVNGLTNGRGRVNGLVNGRTNGLINGLGLVNGGGLAGGPGGIRSIRHRQRERMLWRYRLTGMVLFVTAILMLSMLSNLVQEQRSGVVSIDGNFSDWSDIRPYFDSTLDMVSRPDLNIVEAKVLPERDRLSVFVSVEGTFLSGGGNGSSEGVDTLVAFVDLDRDPGTGYAVGGLGADALVDIYGWGNDVRSARAMEFDTEYDSDDWNGFVSTGTAPVGLKGHDMEFRLYVPRTMDVTAEHPLVLLALQGPDGAMDITDFLMSDMRSAVSFTTVSEGADIITPGASDQPLAHITARTAAGQASLTRLNFTFPGSAGPGDLANIRLVNDTDRNGGLGAGDAPLPATITAAPSGDLLVNLDTPLPLPMNRTADLWLVADLGGNLTSGTLGVRLSNATVPGASVLVSGGHTRLRYVGVPAGITIDGAFGDWAGQTAAADRPGDVLSPDPNATIMNRNADLAEFRVSADRMLNVYLAVSGVMLGGADIPTLRARPGAPPTNVQTDTDMDGVPDVFDPMPFDFNNDGVNNTDENGDWDGDGVAEYPRNGEDYWLNTTIPDDFPANWSGNFVSVYVGPINHTQNLGYDTAYIMLDADSDPATGARMFGARGIDRVAIIAGKHNDIVSGQIFEFDPGLGEIPWGYTGEVSAAVDSYRMELAIDPMFLGAAPGSNITLYVCMEDWHHDHDLSDSSLTVDPASGGADTGSGTRSPAGDNVVLNEISTLPNNAEWIEVANPTGSPIDLGGWYIQIRFFGWRTIYTFPSGTTAGAWGSGSEYVLASDPFGGPWWLFGNQLFNGLNVRLRDSAGNLVDATTIGTLSSGQTWSRFKNETYGMPGDSDSNADWYVSNNNWLVPEGPTPGAPNDRKRPVLNITKTGDITVLPGGQITYTITVSNIGDGLARDIWVNDTLPSWTNYSSSSIPYYHASGGTYTWHLTDMAPGGSAVITLTADVASTAPLGTVLVNVASADYTDQLGRPMAGVSDTWSTTVALPAPRIQVSKVADTGATSPGDTITYTIYYNNTGSGAAGDVWINDTLPAELTFVSAVPPPDQIVGQTLYWHFTDVEPGQYAIEMTADVSSSAAIGSTITNTATCNYTNATGSPMPGSSGSVSLTVMDPASMIVINEIKSAPNNAEWIEIANPTGAPVDLSGWRIRVGRRFVYTFPAGSVIGAWGSGSEYLVVNLANTLRNGGARVRLYNSARVLVDDVRYPAMSNTQSYSRFKHEDTGRPVDTDSAADWYISNNNWIVPEGPTAGGPNDRHRPVMTLEKTADMQYAEPGQTVTYTLWYNNTGDGNAKRVWLNDTLPAGVDFVSASVVPTSVSGQILSWYFPNIVHDSVHSITMTVMINDLPVDGEVLTNLAELTYHDQLKRPMGTVSAWANITCRRPNITVEKVADVGQAVAGDTITYNIYYNNTGSVNAGDVWVNDTLPAGLDYAGASPSPDTVNGTTLEWHFTDVAPGSHSITVTVTVNATAPSGPAVNWAYLDYASNYDYALEPSSDSATVMIPEFRDMGMVLLGTLAIMLIALGRRRKADE